MEDNLQGCYFLQGNTVWKQFDLWMFFTPLTQCWHWESWLSQIWQERLSGNKPLGREGDDRGGDGWMASLTWWTWAWASFGSWWWTGKPGVLQPMGSQSWTRLSDWTDKPLSKRIKQPNELVNIYFTFDINALLYSSIAILHLVWCICTWNSFLYAGKTTGISIIL